MVLGSYRCVLVMCFVAVRRMSVKASAGIDGRAQRRQASELRRWAVTFSEQAIRFGAIDHSCMVK